MFYRAAKGGLWGGLGMNEGRMTTQLQIAATYIRKHSMRFTLALTPALSPDGGEGDRSRGLFEVQGFNARNWFRGILTPSLSPTSWRRGRKNQAFGYLTPHFYSHPYDGPGLVTKLT
jgi:hypothetical protein